VGYHIIIALTTTDLNIVLLLSLGKIKYDVDLREGGIATYVKHVNSLFDGTNKGKLLLASETWAGLSE